MDKKALYFGVAVALLWWLPLLFPFIAPFLVLLAVWGIIISREPFQEHGNVALGLNISGLVLAVIAGAWPFFLGLLMLILTLLGIYS